MKVAVLGAGLMGRALAYDFCRQPLVKSVTVCDVSETQLIEAQHIINSSRASFKRVDIQDKRQMSEILENVNLAIGAVSYQFNEMLTRLCIEKKVNFIDLGGNDLIVDKQFELDEEAKKSEITVIPDCGLAPGLAGIIAAHLFKQFDICESLHLRVGGLPQNPKPPLNYMIVFNVHGLINEYKEPVRIIDNYELKTVPGLSGLEKIVFPKPFGELEAFYTSGGVSTLVKTLLGKVRYLDYKTIRYPGHQEKMKFLMEMGFFDESPTRFNISARDMTEEILHQKLSFKDTDVTLFRVWGDGLINGKKVRKSLEFIDYFDSETGLTSMMRTTAFPAAIIGGMILSGLICKRGVIRQEENVPVIELLAELKKRNLSISETHTDLA